jgi:hypothetical protein
MYLTPKVVEKVVESEDLWPMTREEAERLLADLATLALHSSVARQVQALAVVEVRAIDPDTRVAEVALVDYALYDGQFRRKLFEYPTAELLDDTLGPSTPPPTSSAPAADGQSAPLAEGRYATAAEAAGRALELCEAHVTTRTRLKCGCLAGFVAEQWERQPELHVYTLLNNAVTERAVECANPEVQHAAWLQTCVDDFDFVASEGALRLGKRKYCHCLADRTSDLGPVKAMVSCGMLKDYQVPADSSIEQ